MAQIILRPEFRTAGGEVNDLELDGKYAGTVTLTYRERDRLIGSIQLDKAILSHQEKEKVAKWADDYVHSLADALRVEECEVLVTYAKFDHIITGFDVDLEDAFENKMDEDQFDDMLDDTGIEDIIDPSDRDEYTMNDYGEAKPIRFELVIVGEDDNRIEYHIYGKRKAWLAEAMFVIEETEVYGEVNWMVKPTEDEIEAAADLIVSDFDEEEIDSFQINMKYQGVTLESIELTHEDLLAFEDQWEHSGKRTNNGNSGESRQFSAVLIRDDADALTYDIYEQTQDKLPVGRATVDISHRRLTGFIEFREPTRSSDREIAATALLRELDKEKEYESLNLTMLHQNKRIEDIFFENDTLH
ncbi:MAG: hypothetical protein WD424_00380 [Paenibacillaceae bacterium]